MASLQGLKLLIGKGQPFSSTGAAAAVAKGSTRGVDENGRLPAGPGRDSGLSSQPDPMSLIRILLPVVIEVLILILVLVLILVAAVNKNKNQNLNDDGSLFAAYLFGEVESKG
ncbi:hypothetical protein LZ554_004052 [Drepanopeziza brunnea f. sp. 'monogermtubi']|nr:hypothetical protein LZ554_004052 [Drepanopeziza brunnea f. sp. 'monogermtubi']